MARVQTKITLPTFPKKLPFQIENVSISEYFDRHHSFEISGSLPLSKSLSQQTVENLLGEWITIRITIKYPDPKKTANAATELNKVSNPIGEHTFIGITDSLAVFQQGEHRMIRIEGFSPSILMDSAPTFRVFSECPTLDIAKKIIEKYTANCFHSTNYKIKGITSFSIQSQETDYQYLCRLADQNQTNFFYDGEAFHFSAFNQFNSKTIPLKKDKDIFHFRVQANLCPIKFKTRAHHLVNNKVVEKSCEIETKSNALMKTAIKKSSIYPPATIRLNHGITEDTTITNINADYATKQTNTLSNISGGTNLPTLKIGSIIQINGGKNELPGLEATAKFRVINLTHSIGSGGESYSNNFVAIPAQMPCPISMQNKISKVTGPLMAVITENDDPENLGRVRVKFVMDPEQSSSPWIRVLVPFVSQGGHYFLPEKEEKVTVFFEDFNAEQTPFVMGSFYDASKKADRWNDSDNKLKGISTGAISILFDEKIGQLSIHAKSILLQTDEDINIESGTTISQQAKTVELNGQQKISINGKQGVKVSGARIDLN